MRVPGLIPNTIIAHTMELAKATGEPISVDGWNTLIDWVGIQDFHEAMQIPVMMAQNGVEATTSTYNNLIDAMILGIHETPRSY